MKKQNFLLICQNIWQVIANWIASGSELQVWQESDSHGHPFCWHAYDPVTGNHACFGSEEEIRMWIEQRYYTNSL
ncbi:hypothetical protein ACF3DV_26285 [Chlorogloeopsis fritschii PCC 9212]|uniref:Uncharacterized protein n=1 Tax=Chlorogloeopsis fritschii PCC 6912 TaxID=211165 RepID=A0A433N432_CHLFR|nr:hypothetical protein [Chlorogloeopsis fritschii]RUR76011.1 hypothetical protein PCC6912_45830 [Chlorogloeopsis fritschii PCC 6912]